MIIVPESVLVYHSQSDIQTAVESLLGGREPKTPGNLRWNEVSSFYRACLAARQTQVEFAIVLEQLFQAVWGKMPTNWKPNTPAEPGRGDLSVALSNVWSEGCFSRQFTWRGFTLELATTLTRESGFQLGFALSDKQDRDLLNGELLTGWAQEGTDYYWTQEPIVALTENIDVRPFEEWSKQVWKAVAALT